MAPSHRYDLIAENDEGKDEPREISTPIHTPWWVWWKLILYILLAFSAGLGAAFGVVLASSFVKPSSSAAASAATGAVASTTMSAALTPPTTPAEHAEDKSADLDNVDGEVLDCGWSPEAARERGCVFDVMMQDWVPEPCYDPALTERYLLVGNYTWYADPEGHILSDEEMRKGEHGAAWMSADYHKAHCIFSWEKLIRALRNNEPISQELLSYDHVLHCRMQTLGGDMHKRDGIGVKAPTNYAKCAKYNIWQHDFIPDKHSSIDKKR
jgi:hypothetical protein